MDAINLQSLEKLTLTVHHCVRVGQGACIHPSDGIIG